MHGRREQAELADHQGQRKIPEFRHNGVKPSHISATFRLGLMSMGANLLFQPIPFDQFSSRRLFEATIPPCCNLQFEMTPHKNWTTIKTIQRAILLFETKSQITFRPEDIMKADSYHIVRLFITNRSDVLVSSHSSRNGESTTST
jgi:hypothetical protein